MAHALLGPSGASRWMACTPSARLEETLPEKESDFAKEGSLAHAIAELKLLKKIVEPTMATRKFNAEMKKLNENPLYQEEMQEYTDMYVDFIQEQLCQCNASPFVAVEQRVDISDYVPEAFGTTDCVILSGNTLHVIDFKYGKGVAVYAQENKQMLLYALGVYLSYSLIYDIKQIQMSIVQPRISNFSSWECDKDYLLSFAEEAKEKALLAFEGKGEFVPGEHCKFCRAKATCRARAQEYLELEGWQYATGSQLTLDEVGCILQKAQHLKEWAESLKEWALAQSLEGVTIPGWKAVHGRGSRSFTDTDKAISKLKECGVPEELLYERKVLTLAQMEKVVGKKAFGEYVGELIVSKEGAPTLVAESDKRQAITNRISAEEEFGAVDVNNL